MSLCRSTAQPDGHWTLQVAGLEEAFIYLMAGAHDNFSTEPQEKAA